MGIKKEDMGLRSETVTDMIWTRIDKELQKATKLLGNEDSYESRKEVRYYNIGGNAGRICGKRILHTQ